MAACQQPRWQVDALQAHCVIMSVHHKHGAENEEAVLRVKFDTEIWQGCLHLDCLDICDFLAPLCGRYEEAWRQYKLENLK
jgi:hypothetical protein